MANLLFANNAASTIAAAISASATVVNVATTTGELFPNPAEGEYFVATRADAATGLIVEIVWVTARDADTMTIIRGQEGTAAIDWAAGDTFSNLWTAGQAAAPPVTSASMSAWLSGLSTSAPTQAGWWNNNGVPTFS